MFTLSQLQRAEKYKIANIRCCVCGDSLPLDDIRAQEPVASTPPSKPSAAREPTQAAKLTQPRAAPQPAIPAQPAPTVLVFAFVNDFTQNNGLPDLTLCAVHPAEKRTYVHVHNFKENTQAKTKIGLWPRARVITQRDGGAGFSLRAHELYYASSAFVCWTAGLRVCLCTFLAPSVARNCTVDTWCAVATLPPLLTAPQVHAGRCQRTLDSVSRTPYRAQLTMPAGTTELMRGAG